MDILGSTEGTAQAVDAWVTCWHRVRSYASFCDEIDKAKRTAVESRKKLASDTKEHRRLWASVLNSSGDGSSPSASGESENQQDVKMHADKTETLKAATEQLLREYQQEVDMLTKRAKTAEATFLTLLQLLLQQPDLMVILRDLQASAASAGAASASSVSRSDFESLQRELKEQRAAAQDLISRNAALETEYRELEAEMGKVKDQTITIRQLENQIQQKQKDFQHNLEHALAEREQKIRSQLSGVDAQTQRQLAELAQQLEAAQQQNARLEGRMLQQQQQFVARREEYEQLCQSLNAQLAILSGGQQQRGLPTSASSSGDTSNAATLRALQAAQERLNELLRVEGELEARLAEEKQQRSRLQEVHEASLAEAAAREENLLKRMRRLEQELADSPNERRSNFLASAGPQGEASGGGGEKVSRDTAETVSFLQHENARLLAELEAAHAALQTAKANASAALQETEEKLGQLALQQSLTVSNAAAAAAGSSSSLNAADAGLLQQIVAQREAYKHRLLEAEQERDKWRSMAVAEQHRRESLAAENLQLSASTLMGYERGEEDLALWSSLETDDPDSWAFSKTDNAAPLPLVVSRNRSSKPRAAQRLRGSSLIRGVLAVAGGVATAAADTACSILASRQPQHSPLTTTPPGSPSRTFNHNKGSPVSSGRDRRQQQQQRLLQQLGIGERIVVIWGRALLASRPTRVFALIYFSLLHLLVFGVLFFAADFATVSIASAGSRGAANPQQQQQHPYLQA